MSIRTRLWWLTTAVMLVVGVPSVALAQAAIFTGKVTAENGNAMFGAAVAIEALSIQVGTNQTGQYTLTDRKSVV